MERRHLAARLGFLFMTIVSLLIFTPIPPVIVGVILVMTAGLFGMIMLGEFTLNYINDGQELILNGTAQSLTANPKHAKGGLLSLREHVRRNPDKITPADAMRYISIDHAVRTILTNLAPSDERDGVFDMTELRLLREIICANENITVDDFVFLATHLPRGMHEVWNLEPWKRTINTTCGDPALVAKYWDSLRSLLPDLHREKHQDWDFIGRMLSDCGRLKCVQIMCYDVNETIPREWYEHMHRWFKNHASAEIDERLVVLEELRAFDEIATIARLSQDMPHKGKHVAILQRHGRLHLLSEKPSPIESSDEPVKTEA